MRTASSLNNRRMRAIRRNEVYEAVMTDLCLTGAMPRSVVEALLGHPISKFVTLEKFGEPTGPQEPPSDIRIPAHDEVAHVKGKK